MRWFKRTVSTLLLLVAFGVILAIGFSDHSNDYGRVSLPQGGTVHLPQGKVAVFDRVRGKTSQMENNTAAVAFQVEPVGGGEPIAIKLENGDVSDTQVQRRESIGEFGALAKLDVPKSGDYRVTGSTDLAPGTVYLDFGTNAGRALLDHWKLIAGLVLGALLLTLIPVPRSRRWLDAADPVWSSDPREPYVGSPDPQEERRAAPAASSPPGAP
jgi:hypothetical protein